MKKIIASILAVFFVLLSPLSAYASTTESMMMYAVSDDEYAVMPLSIPANYSIDFSTAYMIDENIYKFNSLTLADSSSNSFVSQGNITGNTSGLKVGNIFSFIPTISGSNLSSYNIHISKYGMNVIDNNREMVLRPTASPSVAYVKYTGVYQFKIYDGSLSGSGGERWVYDRPFEIIKPVSVNLTNFYQESYNNGSVNYDRPMGCDYSFTADFITVNDLLNVYTYKNDINNYYQFVKDSTTDIVNIEDFVLDVVNIFAREAEVVILFDYNNANFTGKWDEFNVSTYLNNAYVNTFLAPSLYNNNLTMVNVTEYEHGYTNDTTAYSILSNGFLSLFGSIGSNLSNVVTNATDNANRIIQNTTQKVDEVKQGVTEVKDSVIETKNSILDLPNKIKDMLLGLIVPSSETMSNKFSEFSNLLEEKLGIIYQVPMMLFDFFDTIVNAATTPQTTLTLPAFQLPWIDGTTLTVWQPMEYKIIPEGMQVLSDLIKTITSMTVVVLTFNSVKRAYERFLRS